VLSKALRKKLEELESDAPGSPTRAEVLADKLYSLALSGNVEAMKMCFDRMEGRPKQSISLDVDDGWRERKVVQYIAECEKDGESVTREEAIADLAQDDPRFEDYE
jgi:hypothetical protein